MSAVRPGYKQTEVGVIPEGWGDSALSDFEPFITSGSRGWAQRYAETGDLFVRITNLTRRNIRLDLSDTKFVQVPADDAEAKRTALKIGDLLVSITADIGIIGYVDNLVPTPAYINQHIACVRLDEDAINPRFVAHFLASVPAQQRFRAITDVGAKTGINLTTVGRLRTALPPFPEQQAIAEALGDADALIEALEALIAKKRDIKQGAMHELLTGQRRLPGLQGEWTKATIGSLFDFGRSVPLSRAQLSDEGDVMYIHYGDIHTRLHTHLDFQRTSTPGAAKTLCAAATPLKIGDWVFADASEDYDGVAKAVEVTRLPAEKSAIAGLHTFVLRERAETFTPKFKGYLAYAPSFRSQVVRAATGMKVFGISKTQMKEIELQFPPTLNEQRAITDVLSDMDAQIGALEDKLAKARAVKQGMIQVLLTGEIRLI